MKLNIEQQCNDVLILYVKLYKSSLRIQLFSTNSVLPLLAQAF